MAKTRGLAAHESEIISAYQSGLTGKEVAVRYGCTAESVYYFLRTRNIPRRKERSKVDLGTRKALRREANKRWALQIRRQALVAYSPDSLVRCACCGETIEVFLTLDHINGGGNAERRMNRHQGGGVQYRMLKRLNYPPGFQVLCWNCNLAKHISGVCPHKTVSEPPDLQSSITETLRAS